MARKFVSGVLAFAMVFGATAPVVFAEPVATEVVDQEANYLPSFEKSEVTVKNGETIIVKVNDIGNDVKDVRLVQAGGNAQDDNGVTSSWYDVKFIKASKSLMITGKGPANADTTLKFKLIPETVFENNYSTEYISLKLLNPNPAAKTFKGWDTTINLTAGKSTVKTLSYTDGTVPASVSVKLTTLASEYVAVSTSDKIENGKKVGVDVTLTGLKSTAGLSAADKAKIRATLTVDGKAQPETTLTVGAATTAAALTLKGDTDKIAANTGKATLVAQAYKTDDYGNLATDDTAALSWSINGVTGLTYKNAKGDTLAELKQKSAGIMEFTAKETGTYNITVTDMAGSKSASRVITVVNAVEPTSVYVAKSATNLTDAGAANYFTTVKPGATVDLSALPYAGTDGSTKALMSTFTGWKATYTTTATRLVSSYDVTTGKFTIVGADDADLIAAMNNADKTAEIPVKVTFTKNGTSLSLNYTIKVTKAGSKAYSLTVTDAAGFKGEATDESNVTKVYTGNKVMSVGTTNEFTAVAKDKNGFTDVAQDMIWYLENTSDKDTNTYAVNNGGKVTALVESAGKVQLIGVSASNPDLKVKIQLYITAATATPTPTATATPAPTATTAPTAAPTTAPATKTGKVTASSLRVRETPVNGTVVGKLAKGTAVTITEEKDGWYKVTAGTLTGWVSGEYVELTTPSTTETATTTANLKLRKTAKTGSVITTMPKGSKVEVLEKGAEWSKVKYNGKTGYASNAYLEFEEDAVG